MPLLLANLAMFAGAVVQGAVGFGLNLIAAPMLLLISTEYLPGPAAEAGFFMALAMFFRDRKHADFQLVAPALVGRIPGVLLGAAIVATAPADATKKLFAATILLGVLLSLIRRPRNETPTGKTMFVAGAASGVMGTVGSIGGPAMALVLQNQTGPRVRANLNAYFVPGTLMTLGGLALFGEFGWSDVLLGLGLIPGLAAGFIVSAPLRNRIDKTQARPVILGISAFSALLAIVTA